LHADWQGFDLTLFERTLNEAWAEPARRFPHFGHIEALWPHLTWESSEAHPRPTPIRPRRSSSLSLTMIRGSFALKARWPTIGHGTTRPVMRATIFTGASCAARAAQTGISLPLIFSAPKNLAVFRQGASWDHGNEHLPTLIEQTEIVGGACAQVVPVLIGFVGVTRRIVQNRTLSW
jgi:hypothetical protein